MNEKAILFDATRCIACRACQVACKQWNELNTVATTNRGTYENPPDLSPDTWLTIRFREKSANGTLRWLFSRRSCMHCTDAACVEVCPTGALYHNEYGFVTCNREACIGCGYCTQYCPFDVPRLDASVVSGVGKIDKCTLCTTPGLDRISSGQEPACVKTCPTGALVFGDRDDLIMQGKERVAALRELHPESDNNPTLYGETELGGLHVLYVLADSPEAYDLPPEPQVPVASLIRDSFLRPYTWALWGAVAAGLAANVLVARMRQRTNKAEE